MILDTIAGALLLATGRARGIERFGTTVQAFLGSLAPLVAFPLVGAIFLLLKGNVIGALQVLAVTLIAQLAPPVLSHILARRWNREAEWLRFATAFNWCQWILPVAGFLFLIALQAATGGTVSEESAAESMILVLACVGLWLHWMIARAGLGLGTGQAILLVILVNAGTGALILSPGVIAHALTGQPG